MGCGGHVRCARDAPLHARGELRWKYTDPTLRGQDTTEGAASHRTLGQTIPFNHQTVLKLSDGTVQFFGG